MDYQRFIDRIDGWIVEHPQRVILLFLVLTGIFAIGLGNVSTEAGTEQFTEDIPAERAFQAVIDEFGPRFGVDEGSTQLIQSGENVLSKRALLRMLEANYRLEQTEELRVTQTASAASIVAQTIDPSATTLEAQINVIERATPTQIENAVREAAEENDRFSGLLSENFNQRAASASATIGVVTHAVPSGVAQGAGMGGSSPMTDIQIQAQRIVGTVDGDIRVFGTGVFAAEFSSVIIDSLLLTVPAAVLFIVVFLVFAYRDFVDLLLGIIALLMAIIWTFGFMGLAGLPFTQLLIAVPPLLLAVGIDFGIHAVNRYREERVQGLSIDESVTNMTDQIVVAFFIVTVTTVIGFISNVTSTLLPIRDFGVVASIGIIFTFFVFGVFLPASKVYVDRLREQYPIPTFSQTPLGSEGSRLGGVLSIGVTVGTRAPRVVLVVMLLVCVGSGVYATGIDTSFSQEDFLPPEDIPVYLTVLPEPFKPSEYTVVRDLNFLQEQFESSQDDSVTVLVRGPMEADHSLEAIYRAGRNPPESFLSVDRHADSQGIITVIQSHAARDPAFAELINRNDRDENGIPDDNLGEIYDALAASSASSSLTNYLAADRRSTRIVYQVKSDAEQSAITRDAKQVASNHRFTAIATGTIVVFQAVSDLILQSALLSLAVALSAASIFLVLAYWVLMGKPSLGLPNLLPIVITVTLVAGSMRLFGVSFNAVTATILAITIGLGIDYSVHLVHRFADEYETLELEPALYRTVQGTGGALTGSMLTTVFGIGVLVLALFPAMGQFGLLTALSIMYSYVTSLFVLPSALVVWARWTA